MVDINTNQVKESIGITPEGISVENIGNKNIGNPLPEPSMDSTLGTTGEQAASASSMDSTL